MGRAFGEGDTRLVRVNGQPGRLLRGRGAPPYGEAERLAIERAVALMKRADVRVRHVLTVDVVGAGSRPCAGGDEHERASDAGGEVFGLGVPVGGLESATSWVRSRRSAPATR